MEDEYNPLSIGSAVAVVQAHNKFTGNSNGGKSGMQEGGLESDGGQPFESGHESDGARSLESGHESDGAKSLGSGNESDGGKAPESGHESDGSGSHESRHGSEVENAIFHDQERADYAN